MLALVATTLLGSHPTTVVNTLASGGWYPRTEVLEATHPIEFKISLKQKNLNTLFDTALAVSTPGNQRYGQYLSPAAIHDLTSPAAADVLVVTKWLDAHGIHYTREREVLHVSTTAALANSLLRTDFKLWHRPLDGRVIIRAGDFHVPLTVAPSIGAIFGVHGAPLPPTPSASTGSATTAPNPTVAKVTPTVLAQTYHVPQPPEVDRGSSNRQAVAEFQGQDMNKADLEAFFSAEVPAAQAGDDAVDKFVGVPYKKGTGVEALLDIEFIMGVAPGVKTEFWEWPEMDFCADLYNYTHTLLRPGGPVVNSISYGWQGSLTKVGCKTSEVGVVDVNWAKLAAAGISVFISSGDSGSQCESDGCGLEHLLKGVEVTDGMVAAHLNEDVEQCCKATSGFHGGSAFTWRPPPTPSEGSAALTGGLTSALRDAALKRQMHREASAAAPPAPPVPPFPFAHMEYHVILSMVPDAFRDRDVIVLDGTVPPEGGPVSVHSGNGTFADTSITFGKAFDHQQELYMRNITMTIKTGNAEETITLQGRATFFVPAHVCTELLWFVPEHPHQFAVIMIKGPNPPPPPPKGNCTIYKSITATGNATDPHVVSGGPAIAPGSYVLYPSWPASSPWVTAVGATRFVGQTVGAEEMATDQFGSGGGFSDMWNRSHASWQANAVAKYLAQSATLDRFPPKGTFPAGGRATPDVSALGEGFQVYVHGKVEAVGGTSASCPTFAGYVSLMNEARLKAGKPRMGFFNPFAYANADCFTDVIKGTNAISRGGGNLTYGFAAAPGWDAATGLGTPLFDKLLAAALKA